jgi:hypothetical protein
VQAEFADALGVGGRHIGGQLTAGPFGLILERDQLVREPAGPGLDLQIFFRQPVHPADTSRRLPRRAGSDVPALID